MSTSRDWSSLEELLLAISDSLVLEERAIGVNKVGFDGDRPLHVAAVWGDVRAIDMLVAAGAEIDGRGEFSFTPLRNAVGQGHVAAVRRLLELGASPHTLGEWGGTPEDLARERDVPGMVAVFDEFTAGRERRVEGPPVIRTARLELSRPAGRDAEAIFERYASDPEVTRFLGWPRHQSVDDTRAFLAFSKHEWMRWPAGPYVIRTRESGRLIGSTGLSFATTDEAVTGYVLAKDSWGQGFATEALNAMVDLARRSGVRRLTALCHPEHRASSRVLEKCGFVRDQSWTQQVEFPNLAPGVPQDVTCYQLLFGS
jgi:RimJ/RimL family protein N-acetyltransferase